MKKSNSSKKILFIVLIILLLLASIIMLIKTNRVNKINNINQVAMGLYTNKIGDVSLDITNQVAEKPNKPKISAGMIPIKYKDGSWQITTADDEEWCNSYNNGKMACMMLNDGVYQSEMQVNMTNKKIATVGTQLQESEMGTIFTWVPRFAYNEENEVLYLKETSSIAGDYKTSEIFTYLGSAVNKEDIALSGIWIEKENKLGSNASNLNNENNQYGLIANTKAEYIKLDTGFVNSINQDNETEIINPNSSRIILKVIDDKILDPIMAKFSAKGKKVKVEIIKADNGIKQVITENGDVFESNEDKTEFTITVEKGGLNRFIIIDNAGNQRVYEIIIVSPEIYVLTNQDEYVEFDEEKWYPYGTQVRIQYMDNMSGIKGWYKEINGTMLTDTTWTDNSTNRYKDFTANETMVYKAKIEDNMGEILGEDELTVHIMPRDNAALPSYYYNYNLGGIYPVKVTGTTSTSSTAYGTEIYPYNTYIRDAARHMGLIQPNETKVLYIKIVPSPQGGYIGCNRNGVNTSSYSYNYNGYVFVTEEGEEILLPKINNVSSKVEDNKITVTVDAKSFNGDKQIEKYYYSIDNGEYEERDNNEFTFEEVQAYKNHTIKVYVKDSYGIISEVTTVTSKTSNDMPIPTIEIVNEEDLETIEYDGKIWYPYNTQIKITYADDMTNLTAYYKTKNETTNVESSWNSRGTSPTYSTSLSESMTYYAKLRDDSGKETEEVSCTIYIMPYTESTMQTNYYNNIGAIYPVKVTGYNSGTIYGTDTYMYQTQIRAAAMHMGLVEKDEIKDLYIKIVNSPSGGYKASTRHGITSSAYNYNYNGYIFVTKDGEEIKSPIIESAVVSSGENSLTVTVTATTNIATIDKYYYSIDDGAYIESEKNIYDFTAVDAYKNHTIKVYVQDSNGCQSDIISIVGKPKNVIPTPTIKIVDEENIETIEYDGKTWYPYGTQLEITYTEDMTNLTAYYKTKNETTKQENSWNTVSTSNGKYTPSLYESMTYFVKLKDATGEESEEASFTIYIMPYTDSTMQANYYNNIGAIYPVRVKGYNSGTIYGTNTYMYQTQIRAAAMHMGLVETDETKDLYIKVVESPSGGYKASTRHGITSYEYLSSYKGYIFVTKDGDEIKNPIIESAVVSSGENELTVTVTAVATTNNATIEKYYYSIDGEIYEESSENTHTFSDINGYKNHTINVYVKDSNRSQSDTVNVIGRPTNTIPMPTIKVKNEETIENIEYNGHKWYPYGTQLTITFNEDTTNLTGWYKTINETTGVESGWSSIRTAVWEPSLYETTTYVVKLQDATGIETDEVSFTTYIMPYEAGYTSSQSNYWNINNIGAIYPVRVSGYNSGTIYGTDTYMYQTQIRAAAMHMGLLESGETKDLYIKIVESPSGGYKASTRNRITSYEYLSSYNGYIFVTKDGKEIKSPTLNSLTTSGGINSINATIQMNYYNDATEFEYYYSIDGKQYEQSSSNEFTFEDVVPYQNHTITVYAKDSNGAISEIYTTTSKASNEIPKPTIEIVNKESLETVEYDGNTWYPYNTQIKITYAEDMTNLTAYYTATYETTKQLQANNSSLGSVTNYTFTLSETMTYKAKIVDATGEEGKIEELEVHIMPNTTLQSNYATYCVGEIFPVIVTGSTSGSIYGSEIYSYNSYIAQAAIHMGLVENGQKQKLFIKVVNKPEDYYRSVKRNGITSNETWSNYNGYVFVTEDGTEIKNNNAQTGDVTLTVAKGSKYTQIDGQKYYLPGTQITIHYTGSGTNYYASQIGTSSASWTNINESSYTTTVTQSTNYYAKIEDAQGNIVTKKTFKINIVNSNNSIYGSYNIGDVIAVQVTGTTSGSVWGTDIYTSDSNVSKAATHAGLVQVGETKIIYVKIIEGQSSYSGTTRNGVTTSSYSSWPQSFTFVTNQGGVTELTESSDVTISPLPKEEIGKITISVPENTKCIEYKGEKWYPYGTTVTITYEGTGTRNNYYGYINNITNSGSGWYSNGTSSTWTTTVYESTTYYAKIVDTLGDIAIETKEAINIMPYASGYSSSQSNYWSSSYLGKIYAVEVTGTTSGTIYGTNYYDYRSNINTAATHMGLVTPNQTKTVFIKTVSYPSGGYIISTKNGITSLGNTNGYLGFVFVTESGEEIIYNNIGDRGATLSGYDVINNGNYYFTNEGDSIKGVAYYSGGYYYSAKSYIILDYSAYSKDQVFKVTLNAENTDYGYMYAKINTTPTADSSSTGRFIDVYGRKDAQDYVTYINGGQKYYLHLERYHQTSSNSTSYYAQFNSLSIEEISRKEFPTITIDENATPIEDNNGVTWYPYGTQVTITYGDEYYKYYKLEYSNGNTYSSGQVKDNNTITFTITESLIIKAGYNSDCEQAELKINIMPYTTGTMQQNYYNNIGAIYPVQVTGTRSYSIYGTGKYMYSSAIATSATHMGLVKDGEEKLVYIKIIEFPEGGYKSSLMNNIKSNEYTTAQNGYVFVDEDGNEILEQTDLYPVTLSGYNVYANDPSYYFANEGDSIRGVGYYYRGYYPARSYIILDYSAYSKDQVFKVTLNAENTDYGYMYATITTTPTADSSSTGRFIDVYGRKDAQDYVTYINGGKKYYLHLERYHSSSSYSTSYYAQFNSLSIEEISLEECIPTITINETATPIEDNNGEEWYPYGTQVTITYGDEYYKYYKLEYSNGNTYSSGQVKDNNTITFTINESSIIKAGYNSDCEQAELKINIMPYTTGTMQQNYYNNIGAIYPVQVTGTRSYSIYGTGKYMYSSAIATSATHMGLVKDGEEKLVYIKIIEFPEGGYKSSLMNNIKSNEYTTAQNGYVFVDEDGNEILEQTDLYPVTLSGYNVYANDLSYYFTNEGDSIRGVGYYYRGYYPARSYIILDYSNYSENDLFKVTLNAENTDYGYMYATITTTPTADSSSTGRFIDVYDRKDAQDYVTYINGGKKYYLHLERYHSSTSYSTSYYAQFNSLKVEPISIESLTPTITVDESVEPVWFNGEPWYPYGTRVTISWGDNNYTNINGSNYHLYKYKNETTGTIYNWTSNGTSSIYTTTLSQTTTYYAKYKEDLEEVSLKINIMPDNSGASNYSSYIDGNIYPITITGDNSNPYGNNIYSSYHTSGSYRYYTYVSRAATHLGIVNSGEQKTVYIKIVPSPEGGYKSVKKYNSTSNNLTDTNINGFIFVKEDGTEIIAPTVKSASLSIGSETAIIATMDVQGNNGAKVTKYYYSIDNGPYQESESNIYTFTDTEAYKIHSVKMYARDENGATSELQELTTSVVTNNVMPIITIDENVTPIEDKEGNEWYPYGTQLTITYADDMKNLTGYYQYIDERTGSMSSWSTTSSKTYTVPLYYSVTYMAKIMDNNSKEETDVVSKKINVMPSETNGANYYYSYLGNIYPVQVTGSNSGSAYGTDTYYYGSNISAAAMHMGLLDIDETKTVYIKIVKAPVAGYIGSTRYGVTTSNYQYTYNGFVFIDEDGNEITRPKINSVVTTSGENSIIVTVDAKSEGADIVNYYYSIDDQEYIETTENIHKFDNITTSGNHTIKVYVKDDKDNISPIKQIYGYRITPVPTFTFNREPVIYNGEKWYPYNTVLYINFSNSDSGYYRNTNPHTNSNVSSWTSSRSYPYSVTLSESMIYEAYNYNGTSGESDHIREKINIMPNPNSLQSNYYNYGSGNVYPVEVTGTTSGTIYGTGTYYYSSNINTAATHAGLVGVNETKVVYIKIVPCPEGGYKSSTQNGITSSSRSSTSVGFTFVK